MNIHILVSLKEGPWGGGNQFLKALRSCFREMNCYEENPQKADVILFNSFPFGEEKRFLQASRLKKRRKILVHRIDGPIFKIRNDDFAVDRTIYAFNHRWADGTIFQSEWSQKQNHYAGMPKNKYETIILNAPDPKLFHDKGRKSFQPKKKIRLIATSWSSNMKKGFGLYKYLDKNLDFSKYEMTFIGNSPFKFKNIKWIKPLPPEKLAAQLRKHDIFVTASQVDPCSNSLIEALHCGLPAVGLNNGGHPEIIRKAGVLFNSENDLIPAIQRVASNYKFYQEQIKLPSLSQVADDYYSFMETLFQASRKGTYVPKRAFFFQAYSILLSSYQWKLWKTVKSLFQ